MLTRLEADTSLVWVLCAFLVFGVGFGAVNPPITNAAVSGLPPAQAGVAAAIASTSRQVGASFGVAVVGAVAVATTGSRAQLADAAHPGWWILTGCGLAVLLLGLATTTRWAVGTARAVAATA